MESSQENSRSLVGSYEAVFCVFMAVLAYLWRDNPSLSYPQILYLFVTLMLLNLAAGMSLRLWPSQKWISAAFTLANCAAVTALLAYSGGAQSNLWVLYLLPIYTACLLLDGPEVFWVTLGTAGFNAGFLAVETPSWDGAASFQLLLKSGIFILSATLMWKMAQRDRASRTKLQAGRLELARLEDLARAQTTRLDKAERLAEVGLLSSGLAHDLSSTFTVILGFADILLESGDPSEERRAGLLQLRKSAVLGLSMVSNLVGLARKEKLSLSPCELGGLAQETLKILESAAARGGVRLLFEGAGRALRVPGSAAHLQRLLMNLVLNALKALKRGGEVRVHLEALETLGGSPRARLIVEDDGPGIPNEMLDRLFTPFATTRQALGGTGLGLYVSSEIAKQHGGTLRAANKPEGGARFTLDLPAWEGEEKTSAPEGSGPSRRAIEPCASP